MTKKPTKSTVPRALIVEREYEPSRMNKMIITSSYEILVPVVSAKLRLRRRGASDKDKRPQWEGAVASGGRW